MTDKIDTKVVEKLVGKAQKGDRSSFNELFEIYFDRIYRYIGFRVSEEDVEDLTGDVFLKFVENIHKYKFIRGASFSAWIFRIAHNRVIDFYRKKKDILGIGFDEDEDFWAVLPDEKELKPNEKVLVLDREKEIREVLAKLPVSYREILELKFLEDFSNREISEITGKNEGNIRIIQLRALREMRKYVKRDEI